MRKTAVVFLLSCAATQSIRAEGLSSFEGPGLIDALIKFCGATFPEKAGYYKQGILQSFSCGRSVSETEKMISDIRNNMHPQVQAAYQRTYNQSLAEFERLNQQQKTQACVDSVRATSC